MVVLVVICILVVGMLGGARQSSDRVATAAGDPQPHVDTQVVDVRMAPDTQETNRPTAAPATAAPLEMYKTNAKKSAASAVRAAKAVVEEPATETPAAALAAKVLPPASVAGTTAVESTADARAESSVKTDGEDRTPVTISGCVEVNESDNTFRLTDTDAPKSRSWKSGFLKRRSAPVALNAAANAVALQRYVGQRISATGVLMNHEMQVRSLRPAGSCSS